MKPKKYPIKLNIMTKHFDHLSVGLSVNSGLAEANISNGIAPEIQAAPAFIQQSYCDTERQAAMRTNPLPASASAFDWNGGRRAMML